MRVSECKWGEGRRSAHPGISFIRKVQTDTRARTIVRGMLKHRNGGKREGRGHPASSQSLPQFPRIPALKASHVTTEMPRPAQNCVQRREGVAGRREKERECMHMVFQLNSQVLCNLIIKAWCLNARAKLSVYPNCPGTQS